MSSELGTISNLLDEKAERILTRWRELSSIGVGVGRIKEAELEAERRSFLNAFSRAVAAGATSIAEEPFGPVRAILADLSRSRAAQGFTPAETATFVFSFKQPLFEELRAAFPDDARTMSDTNWRLTQIVDQLGLHTMDVYQKTREEVVRRQQEEIAELSTPVVKLWDGIIALPLIGTLDSSRTQVVMENLLHAIVAHSADLAIIDITGVPTVDTLVAQHLLKTIAAARLMGADCIVSGIRPQIAQTMVHLGVELDVVSKATLADALALAFKRTGRTVRKLAVA